MKAVRANNLTNLHERVVARMAHAPMDYLDGVNSLDVQLHDVLCEAESMDEAWGDNDLKRLWLTESRWTTMVKQYIDPDRLDFWLDRTSERIGKRGRGISVLRSNEVEARGGWVTGHTNRATRVWGSCMLSWSYKASPRPTITMHSRTTYLGYIAMLDLSIAWNLARYLGQRIGLDPAEFKLVWFVECMQFHNFKSLAYFLNHPDPEQRLQYRHALMAPDEELNSEAQEMLAGAPAMAKSRSWMRRFVDEDERGVGYGDMNYNQYRRVRRRYHTEMYGPDYGRKFEGANHKKADEHFAVSPPLPSVLVRNLDFSPISKPLQSGEEVSYGEAS